LRVYQQNLFFLLTFCNASQIPIKSPGSGRGQLEITYLDEELRYLPFIFIVIFSIIKMHTKCCDKTLMFLALGLLLKL
jgi:hypothetical protein